jgi:hypothetical protein
MRSLKPKETAANAISVKAATDLQNEITRLQEQLVSLKSNIDAIENTLESPNVGRGNATFGTLQSTDLNVNRNTNLKNANIEDLKADKIETPDIEATNATVTNVLDANQVNTPKLNADEVKTDSVQSDEVTTDDLTATTLKATNATLNEATIDNANIATANIDNYVTNKVNAVEVETASLDTDELHATEAEINELNTTDAKIESAEIEKARIENRYYISDKPGKTIQLTQVEEQHPAWICLDTRGCQNAKIIAKDLTGELFSVMYTNTRHTPLIQWSKRNDEAIQRFFYNYKTNKLYIETWMSCEFQWQIDGYEETPFIPSTFQDDFPENLLDCYKYSVGRKHGIVLMGEQGADTVLSVQGAIEGSFLIDKGEFTYLDFYSDSAWDLFNVAKSFFRSGSDEDGWQYEKAECWGYLKHTDEIVPEHYEYDLIEGGVNQSKLTQVRHGVDGQGLNYRLYTYADDVYAEKSAEPGVYVKVGYFLYKWSSGWAYTNIQALDENENFITGRGDSLWDSFSIYEQVDVPETQSPARDADNTEIEALEKIEYIDENTIKLTIDNAHGQDEILINCEDLQEDEKLPFILGFTIRTPRIDYAFNREAKQLAGSSDNSYYGG